MPLQEDYQVRLDAFFGPLDLLLYLIRRAEVDIHDIPIAEITDQYLKFLGEVDEVDIEAAGEFLVMAATLMEIKSRTLMPAPAADAEPDEAPAPGSGRCPAADPRFELVQQLLEYQRFRLAAEQLAGRGRLFSRMFPARPTREERRPSEPAPLELEDAHVYDLYEAYERITAAIDFDRLGDHRVRIDDTPAAVYQQNLLDRLREAGGGLTLQELFEGRDRAERIGLFLAVLELVRLRRVAVRQEELRESVTVELAEQQETDDAEEEPVPQPE